MRLYFGGECKPSPGGDARYGFVIEDDGGIVGYDCGIAERCSTYNRAEYIALIKGMQAALDSGIHRLQILGSAMTVISQMRRLHSVQSKELLNLYEKAQELHRRLRVHGYEFIPYKKNPATYLARYGRLPPWLR